MRCIFAFLCCLTALFYSLRCYDACVCVWQLIELNNNVDVDGGDTRAKEEKNIPTIFTEIYRESALRTNVSGENYERGEI